MKKWYLSKTVWAAVLVGVVGIEQSIQPYMDAHSSGIALSVVGAINLILRMLTKDPITGGQ